MAVSINLGILANSQDYRVHRDEIYTKLVQIMRERLLAHLHELPKVVEGWNRPPDTNKQTKEFAWPLTRVILFSFTNLIKIIVVLFCLICI